MEEIRLNKYLAQAGVCSRRDADKIISQGRVCVNGQPADMGQKVTTEDTVTVDGKIVTAEEEKHVYAYYKPIGVTCTSRDPHAERVLMDEVDLPSSYTYAGRLDKDSEGLLLLTNDGDLNQGMMRAIHHHEKEYLVRVDKEITEDFLREMKNGVYLAELETTTNPCKVRMIGVKTFGIILTQGLNRQIRRMCETLGYRVMALKRIRVVTVKLGDMKPGDLRLLDEEETKRLYTAVERGIKDEYPSNRK